MSEPARKKTTGGHAIADPWEPDGEGYTRPARYLMERGWTPDGHPDHPGTRWLDPLAPAQDVERRERVGEITRDNGEVLPVEQVMVTCRAWPMTMQEAIGVQRLREGK